MVARSEAAAATAEGILDAMTELFWEQPSDQIRLDQVAARARVTVQTVLRRFGSKEKLFAAAVERQSEQVRAARARVTPGDVPSAVANLVEHYELMGDRVLRMLAEEEHIPALKVLATEGRRIHREWCEHAFGPFLPEHHGSARNRRRAQLVTICDIYTWKLLRRESRLSRRQTQKAIAEMLAPFTKDTH
ncbi:TetR/AcrR family transcriptional regulator [Arthrobacter sp. FW306-04-A]|uniref:TetR/AcrR family transcriptional regulator n=1 Tax=Arthrobacter sp. FW306-04-A TaxID=2879619 RepID=UPI0037BFDFBD|nr:TetR/AcrR family transcriptional regulator [Arthrobacter sp. FW306-04-A]